MDKLYNEGPYVSIQIKGKSYFKKGNIIYYPSQDTFECERVVLLYQENRQTRIIPAK